MGHRLAPFFVLILLAAPNAAMAVSEPPTALPPDIDRLARDRVISFDAPAYAGVGRLAIFSGDVGHVAVIPISGLFAHLVVDGTVTQFAAPVKSNGSYTILVNTTTIPAGPHAVSARLGTLAVTFPVESHAEETTWLLPPRAVGDLAGLSERMAEANLSWVAASAEGYRGPQSLEIWRRDVNAPPPAERLAILPAHTVSFTEWAKGGKTYEYTVRTVNVAGHTDASVTVSTVAPPPASMLRTEVTGDFCLRDYTGQELCGSLGPVGESFWCFYPCEMEISPRQRAWIPSLAPGALLSMALDDPAGTTQTRAYTDASGYLTMDAPVYTVYSPVLGCGGWRHFSGRATYDDLGLSMMSTASVRICTLG